jgi:glycosyltransferase involved in cell wall biosynthesis
VPDSTPIALCITDLDPGGAERALVQIATRLDRAVWNPVVYCLSRRGALAEQLEAAGIETHCLDAGPRDVRVISRLTKLLRRQRPQLLQSFLFHANLAGRIAAWRAGVPVVVSGIRVAERQKRWHLALDRWTRRLVTHHVCVSQAVAGYAEHELRLRPGELSVILNGVDAALYAYAPPLDLTTVGVPAGARTLLFVGRLHPQKGVMVLLDAFRQIATEAPDVQLVMVGSGPLAGEAKAWIVAHNLQSRVHWLGPRNDVPSLMRSATALVLPSLWEGMPNVVLEAMAARLPVVATAVDGTRELLADGVTGWLCEAGSSVALTDQIRAAISDLIRAGEMAARSQVTVQKHFTWESAAAGYDRLWRSLL